MSEIRQQALTEIVQAAGNPDEAMDELGTHINLLHGWALHHGETELATVINNTWGLVDRIYKAAGASFALLVAARELAGELSGQRDAIIDRMENLQAGLADPWGTNNPLVQAVVEKIREAEGEMALEQYQQELEIWKLEEFEQLAEDAQEYADEVINDSIADEISDTLGITTFYAYDVLEVMRGGEGNLTEAEKDAFLTWLVGVQQRQLDERKARREKSA